MSLPHHLIPTRKHVASSPQPLSTPSPLSIPFLTAPLPAPSPVVFAAGLLDRAKAADISGLVPAGPKDPTPDAQRLEAERLALAQDSALRKAILSEVGLFMASPIMLLETRAHILACMCTCVCMLCVCGRECVCTCCAVSTLHPLFAAVRVLLDICVLLV
jgi:hypothetical protein